MQLFLHLNRHRHVSSETSIRHQSRPDEKKTDHNGQSPLGSGFRLRRTTGGLLADDTKIRALYLQMSGNFANIAGQSRRFGRQRRQSVPLYRHCPSGRLSRNGDACDGLSDDPTTKNTLFLWKRHRMYIAR